MMLNFDNGISNKKSKLDIQKKRCLVQVVILHMNKNKELGFQQNYKDKKMIPSNSKHRFKKYNESPIFG
jgi:hypothetical protein